MDNYLIQVPAFDESQIKQGHFIEISNVLCKMENGIITKVSEDNITYVNQYGTSKSVGVEEVSRGDRVIRVMKGLPVGANSPLFEEVATDTQLNGWRNLRITTYTKDKPFNQILVDGLAYFLVDPTKQKEENE